MAALRRSGLGNKRRRAGRPCKQNRKHLSGGGVSQRRSKSIRGHRCAASSSSIGMRHSAPGRDPVPPRLGLTLRCPIRKCEPPAWARAGIAIGGSNGQRPGSCSKLHLMQSESRALTQRPIAVAGTFWPVPIAAWSIVRLPCYTCGGKAGTRESGRADSGEDYLAPAAGRGESAGWGLRKGVGSIKRGRRSAA